MFGDDFLRLLLPQRIFYLDIARAGVFEICCPRRNFPRKNFLARHGNFHGVGTLRNVLVAEKFTRRFAERILAHANNLCRRDNRDWIFDGSTNRFCLQKKFVTVIMTADYR